MPIKILNTGGGNGDLTLVTDPTNPTQINKTKLNTALLDLFNLISGQTITQVANYAALPTTATSGSVELVLNTTTQATTIYPAGLYVYITNAWKYMGLNIDNNTLIIANNVITLNPYPTVNQLTINNLPSISTDTATKGYVDSLTSAILQIPINYSIVNNTPAIADNTGTPGNTYAVTDGGSRDFGSGSITTIAGDVLYIDKNKKVTKYPVSNSVKSVNGKTGIVTLAFGDLTNVVLTNLTNNQIIAYQNSSGNFVNITLAPVALSGSYSDLSNKPTLGTAAALNVGTAANNVVQLDSNSKLPAVNASQLTNITASQLSGLATVATTGSYNDLINKPNLATVATSGSYTDLINRPTLGTASAQNVGTSANNVVQLDANSKLPAVNASALTNITASQISGLSTVATSNSYNDLSNKPTLGTAAALNAGTSATNLIQLDSNAKIPAIDGSQITNITSAQVSGLSTVATTGSYNDLSNKPSIPPGFTNNTLTFTTSQTLNVSNVQTTIGLTLISLSNNITLTAPSGFKFLLKGVQTNTLPMNYGDTFYTTNNSTTPTLITVNGYNGNFGTGAFLNVGTSGLNLVQLDTNSKLPAVNASQLTNITSSQVSGLATIATTGIYSDLSNKPTLGTVAQYNVGTSANNIPQLDSNAKLPAINGSQLTNLVASQISGLSNVATSGSYNDLSNRPTLGTAAALNVGTVANNVVQLDFNAKLPAVDGSQLTGLPAGYATQIVTLNTSSTLSLASITPSLGLTGIVTADNITTTAPTNYTFNYRGNLVNSILMQNNEIYYFTMNTNNSTIIYVSSYSKPHSRPLINMSANASYTQAQLPQGYFIEIIFTANCTLTIASGITFSPVSSTLATNGSGVTAQTIVGNTNDVYIIRADPATPTVYNILSNNNILNYQIPSLATNNAAIAAGDTYQTIVNKASTSIANLQTNQYATNIVTLSASTTLSTANINNYLSLTAIVTADNIVTTAPSGYTFSYKNSSSTTIRMYNNEIYYFTMNAANANTIYVSSATIPNARPLLTISANTTYNSFQIPAGYFIYFSFTGNYTLSIPSGISFSPVSGALNSDGTGVTAQSIVGKNGDVYLVRADPSAATTYNILAYNNILTYGIGSYAANTGAYANGDTIQTFINKTYSAISARTTPILASYVYLTQNTTQTLNNNGSSILIWDTVTDSQQPSGDAAMWSSSSNSKITIQRAGLYDIYAFCRVDNSPAGNERGIYIVYTPTSTGTATTIASTGSFFNGGEVSLQVSFTKKCFLGDVFQISYYNGSTSGTITTSKSVLAPVFQVTQRGNYITS